MGKIVKMNQNKIEQKRFYSTVGKIVKMNQNKLLLLFGRHKGGTYFCDNDT